MRSYFKSMLLAITIAFLIITTAHAQADFDDGFVISRPPCVDNCALYVSMLSSLYVPCLTIDQGLVKYWAVLTYIPGTDPARFELTYFGERSLLHWQRLNK